MQARSCAFEFEFLDHRYNDHKNGKIIQTCPKTKSSDQYFYVYFQTSLDDQHFAPRIL